MMSAKQKKLEMDILEELMSQMDDYGFEKKMKPKLVSVEVKKEGEGELPRSIKEMLGGKEDPEEMSMESEGESEEYCPPEEEDDDELGSRFKKLLGKK